MLNENTAFFILLLLERSAVCVVSRHLCLKLQYLWVSLNPLFLNSTWDMSEGRASKETIAAKSDLNLWDWSDTTTPHELHFSFWGPPEGAHEAMLAPATPVAWYCPLLQLRRTPSIQPAQRLPFSKSSRMIFMMLNRKGGRGETQTRGQKLAARRFKWGGGVGGGVQTIKELCHKVAFGNTAGRRAASPPRSFISLSSLLLTRSLADLNKNKQWVTEGGSD